MRGDSSGHGGDAEFADGHINKAAIERTVDANQGGNKTLKMWMLRVGKFHQSDSIPSNTAINHGDEPPQMNGSLRQAELKLADGI